MQKARRQDLILPYPHGQRVTGQIQRMINVRDRGFLPLLPLMRFHRVIDGLQRILKLEAPPSPAPPYTVILEENEGALKRGGVEDGEGGLKRRLRGR